MGYEPIGLRITDFLLPAEGRLTPSDLQILARIVTQIPPEWRIGQIHPSRGEQRVSPRLEAIRERSWDLERRRPPEFDVLIAGRLPGFAHEAELAFRSARESCRLLVVLDSGQAPEPSPRFLATGLAGAERVRLYRGDFSDPLLRVDDYPTGVRPILSDLGSLHEVLTRIDEAGLAFHLGIVPAILEDRMVPFLRGLTHLIVSMHGFEHGYEKQSQRLIAAGDPGNQKGTVTGFDEFAGQGYEQILEQLERGRRILETRLGQLPASYIPPCNESNRHTGRALVASGFQYVLSEKSVPGCDLPVIGSEFYDRSSAFKPEFEPKVASLHVTWEADLLRAGDRQSLASFLDALVRQRTRTREQIASTADRIASAVQRG